MKKLLVVLAVLVLGSLAQAALVAEWSFEQNLNDTATGGTVADTLIGQVTYAGNGVYATTGQDPIYVSNGISGYAAQIGVATTTSTTGATYLTTTIDSADLTSGVFTMEGYFNASSVDYAYTRLLTKWVSGFTMSYHFTIHNGALEIIEKNSSGTNVTVTDDVTLAALGVEAGEWFHVAVTGDGSTLTLWLNGVAIASGAYDGTMTDSTAPFWIGGRTDMAASSNNAFIGLVDEVRIWNEAKDAAYMQAQAAAIPEPATIALLVLGGLGLVRRK